MDTVALCDESKRLYVSKGKLKRRQSALGADDRAGINIIMNHFRSINFIFTRDEEIGRLGAKELAKHQPFLRDLQTVSCVVELDCAGHKKIRGAVHGYCCPDLVTDVKKVIPDVKDTHGSFSDLDSFISIKPGVNLSVGYYKQHTYLEYLVLSEYEYVNGIVRQLNKDLTGEYKVYVPPPRKYYDYRTQTWSTTPPDYTRLGYKSIAQRQKTYGLNEPLTTIEQELVDAAEELEDAYDDVDEYMVCDSCSAERETLTFVDTLEMFLCDECLADVYADLQLIIERGGLFESKVDSF